MQQTYTNLWGMQCYSFSIYFILYLANEKVAEILLSNGAHVNAMNNENETALHWAALNSKS